jgi:hypothetical protein
MEGRSVLRSIGLDVHREFSEVAIREDGKVRSAGRIKPAKKNSSSLHKASAKTTRSHSR